jgi:hypothetical protein
VVVVWRYRQPAGGYANGPDVRSVPGGRQFAVAKLLDPIFPQIPRIISFLILDIVFFNRFPKRFQGFFRAFFLARVRNFGGGGRTRGRRGGIVGVGEMGEADAVAGGGIVLLGGGEMAHECVGNVGESGGAACGDLSSGELEVQTTQGIMNAAGVAEIQSAVGDRQETPSSEDWV